MTKNKTVMTICALAAVGLMGAGQMARGQGPGMDGGPGQGPGGGGRPPFVSGTVSAVDTSAGTITVKTPFGDSQTVNVSSSTQIMTQTTASVSDLKVNDIVELNGVPSGITASALTIGQMPGMAGPPPPGDPNDGNGNGPGGPPQGAGGPPPEGAQAMVHGHVVSVSPLTIGIGTDVTITIKLASTAKIVKFKTTALSAIKVGDRINASGDPNEDGTLDASTVGVNVTDGRGNGRGRGGFGMRPPRFQRGG